MFHVTMSKSQLKAILVLGLVILLSTVYLVRDSDSNNKSLGSYASIIALIAVGLVIVNAYHTIKRSINHSFAPKASLVGTVPTVSHPLSFY